jgi:hypothetical protein
MVSEIQMATYVESLHFNKTFIVFFIVFRFFTLYMIMNSKQINNWKYFFSNFPILITAWYWVSVGYFQSSFYHWKLTPFYWLYKHETAFWNSEFSKKGLIENMNKYEFYCLSFFKENYVSTNFKSLWNEIQR